MTTQVLTIGKRRFVLMPESDFRKLQRRAAKSSEEVRPEFAEEAMRELRAYRKAGKASDWKDIKRRLGL